MPDIQDYIEYIIKKQETLTAIIKTTIINGYKIELQTPETMKLFGSKKNDKQNKKLRKYVQS